MSDRRLSLGPVPRSWVTALVLLPICRSASAQDIRLTLTGLVQGWYVANDARLPDSFRLRRAEIGLEAIVAPKVAWRMMIDAAKGTSFLQDAHLTLGTDRWAVDVGRFKVPISREGLQSSSTLETIERARFTFDKANGGELGDVRDVGVKLRGATK
jgi:hypothetical protein